MSRAVLAGLSVALLAACAPDPVDTYSVDDPEAPPATRAPLPTTTTTAPAGGEEGETGPTATFGPNGQTVDIRSIDNSFIQQDIEVEAGTEVNWINGGRNDHNILPVDESLDWGIDRDTFVPGEDYAHLFDTPGVYPYYCSIHGTAQAGMIGSVVVVEPA